MSFEMQSRVIGSSGAITYSSATLLVTDSTPEGPVPYEIDGNAGYQTGSTYTISVGVHTIELPSPYTSPVSDITYNFSYWQDGPTDNPRTVTLEPDATASLHGTYSTNSTPPPTPPSPPPPNGNYVGYSGFEGTTQGPDGFYYVTNGPHYKRSVTSFYDSGSIQFPSGTVSPYAGSYMMEFGTGNEMGWPNRHAMNVKAKPWLPINPATDAQRHVYVSEWLYYPTNFDLQVKSGVTGQGPPRNEMLIIRLWPWEHNIWVSLRHESPWQEEDFFWRFGYTDSPGQSYISGGYYYEVRGDSEPVAQWSSVGTVSWETFRANANGGCLPLGRWFRIEYYIYRHLTNGIFKVWITDPYNPDPAMRDCKLLFGIEGTRTYSSGATDIDFTILKWYCPTQENWPEIVLADDFYLYDYNAHEEA